MCLISNSKFGQINNEDSMGFPRHFMYTFRRKASVPPQCFLTWGESVYLVLIFHQELKLWVSKCRVFFKKKKNWVILFSRETASPPENYSKCPKNTGSLRGWVLSWVLKMIDARSRGAVQGSNCLRPVFSMCGLHTTCVEINGVCKFKSRFWDNSEPLGQSLLCILKIF